MIKLLLPVPDKIFLAVSGGVDSMAALSFLGNKKSREITPVFFDHGTKTSKNAIKFLKNRMDLLIGEIQSEKTKNQSPEEYWRIERYNFLNSLNGPVITAHHLNDAVETWIFSSLHGQGKLIPPKNKNVIRPFLITKKQKLIDYCKQHDVTWIEDESNKDVRFSRNKIRHDLMQHVKQINPGIEKTITKKYLVTK